MSGQSPQRVQGTVNRPPLSPNLGHENERRRVSTSQDSPPTISAFVAEAVVYLRSMEEGSLVNLHRELEGEPISEAADATRPVFTAVARILDTMTTHRLNRAQNNADQSDAELTVTSDATAEFGNSRLHELELAFQHPNPEFCFPETTSITNDGTFVCFAPRTKLERTFQVLDSASATSCDMQPANAQSLGLWQRLVSLISTSSAGASCARDDDSCPASPTAAVVTNEIEETSSSVRQIVNDLSAIQCGPIKQCAGQGIRHVQGYSWESLEDYFHDQRKRRRHFLLHLTNTRQFMPKKSRMRLRHAQGTDPNSRAEQPRPVDHRRAIRKQWFDIHGLDPEPRVFYTLQCFHKKPEPVFDHFQLKDLMCLCEDKLVYYLSKFDHRVRTYTCVMSYNLQSGAIDRVLGPWSFDRAKVLCNREYRPVYNSMTSVSFESRYLFSLAVTENYIATTDTASSILISKKPRRKGRRNTKKANAITNESDSDVPNALPHNEGEPACLEFKGVDVICQRISMQPLQIINVVEMIEHDQLDDKSHNDALVTLIQEQALLRSDRLMEIAFECFQRVLSNAQTRADVLNAWKRLSKVEPAPGEPEATPAVNLFTSVSPRAFLRRGSVTTPGGGTTSEPRWASVVLRRRRHRSTWGFGADGEVNSSGPSSPSSSSDDSDVYIPQKAGLTVLCAGNDRTLSEFFLASSLCRESKHIKLENGDIVCRCQSGSLSGFSTCSRLRKKLKHPHPLSAPPDTKNSPIQGVKYVLKLVRSRKYPFCINRIALHPDGNIMILVGDHPDIILTARRSHGMATKCYGLIKNSLFTVKFHQDSIFAAAWHPNGIIFATGSDDRTIAIWDLRQLEAPTHVLCTEVTACRKLAFSPDGNYLLSCESEDACVIYSVADKFKYAQKVPFFGACTGAAFTADSKRIIIGVGSMGGIMELAISHLPHAAARLTHNLLV